MIQRQFQATKFFAVLIGLLRHRKEFLEEIRQGIRIQSKITALLICSSLFFAIYGGIIGASHSGYQALASAIKLPALYLLTLIICLPTLYFFNVLFGSKQTFGQHFTLVMTAVSVMSVLLFSFAPVTLFFMISTRSYQFFIVLNVAILGLTGYLGVHFLYKAMQFIFESDSAGRSTRTKLLQFWLGLYAFVGSQLGWTLRPFFGTPGSPFQLFREKEGNFYLSVIQSIGQILGLN